MRFRYGFVWLVAVLLLLPATTAAANAPTAARISSTIHSGNGNDDVTLGTGLIDPFGTVTNKATNAPIPNATMELRWADTKLNTDSGRTPHTKVDLPSLPGFLPADNANPQQTDELGQYAWMVFPDGDYYIVATASGFQTFDSSKDDDACPDHTGQDSWICNGIMHVGNEIVEYNIAMTPQPPRRRLPPPPPPPQAPVVTPPGTVRDAATGSPLPGVLVSLLWADTEANRSAGRVPGTLAHVPAPTTDELGRYSVDCPAHGDVYVVAKKEGYLPYDSRTDSRIVAQEVNGCIVGIELEPMKLAVLPQYTRYILGYPDGTFMPERAVTRAEVAAIFTRLIGNDLSGVTPVSLTDVPASHWAARHVNVVMASGLMGGDPDGSFRPDAPMTRAELATVIVRYKGLALGRTGVFADTADHWADAYITATFHAGIALGYVDNTFAPNETTKRAELVTMLNRMLGWAQLVTGSDTPRWTDVPHSYWAARHIEKASITHTAQSGPDQMDYVIEILRDSVP